MTRITCMLAAAALLLTAPALPTMEEVRKGMYEAYRAVRNYRDVWEFAALQDGKPGGSQVFERKLDGPHGSIKVSVGGDPVFMQMHDGKRSTLVAYGPKVYAREIGPNLDFTTAFSAAAAPKAELNSFAYNARLYDIEVVSNPPFQVKTFAEDTLNGKKVRKLTAFAEKTNGKGTLNLTLWFEADRWILRGVRLEGKSDVAGTFTLTGTLKEIDLAAKFTPGDFAVEASAYPGYQEVPMSSLRGG